MQRSSKRRFEVCLKNKKIEYHSGIKSTNPGLQNLDLPGEKSSMEKKKGRVLFSYSPRDFVFFITGPSKEYMWEKYIRYVANLVMF